MPPLLPSILSHTKRWFSRRRSPAPEIRLDDNRHERTDASFFADAQDVTVHGGQFKLTQTNHHVNNTISNRNAVFELLKPYTCLDATKDSSTRHPPPRCHPGTREKIRERLMQWVVNEYDQWKMLWVRGFAGTGKSAVAQSFADSCDEKRILGGSYFFFRAAARNKPNTVVPTLVYQLATNVPKYKAFIEHRLAENPSLLENSPPVQFRKLIVEPFTVLQRECPRKPIAIVLDGFDECEGEDAQQEILDMITNAIRMNPDLPLRWLIFSRPEAHLKNAFSRNSECGREELIIDAECRDNVENYVKDKLCEIKATYNDITPADWPPETELGELVDTTDGLFILASTCVNYIGDRDEADPVSQLDDLLKFMRRLEVVGSRNPLTTLDFLYSRVLEDVPPMMFPTTWRILACLSIHGLYWVYSAQALSNFLRLDQRTFYKAVRGLHSVMWIPDLEDAAQFQLRFYHASFQDFLLDPNRSGKFSIDPQTALVDIIMSSIYWCDIYAMHFHTNDGWDFDLDRNRDGLHGLSWVSDDNRVALSRSIMDFIQRGIFGVSSLLELDNVDENLLSQASNIDFRYWRAESVYQFVRICRLDPSTLIVRVEPSNPWDHQLLEYFNLVIKNGVSKPATFPLSRFLLRDQWTREYFFIGNGAKSVIVWRTYSPTGIWRTHSLHCDLEPSEALVSQYERDLETIGWNEGIARGT